jgi:hypothetical protein
LPATGTVQVISGDFNGDGIADIAALGQSDISVFLGEGNRQFRLGSVTQLPGTTSSYIGMVAADFNLDGKLDLAVFGGTGFLLLGNGDGTFRQGVTLPSTSTPVATADFNGDGKPDLAVGTPSGIGIYLGKGDGTFAPPAVIPGSSAACIATGDLNGDGKPDIASCNLIYLGKGNGTFSRGIPFALPSQADFLAIGDLNLDGKADMVAIKQYINGVSESLGPVYVLFGNGDGTFRPAVQIASDAGTLLPTAAIGDVNGDGLPDIVVLGAGGLVGVLTNNGHNGFNLGRVEPVTFLYSLPWGSVALADLTGHGLDILASGNFSRMFSVLFENGYGGFKNVRSLPIPNVASLGGADNVTPVARADFNGDGLSDLAFVYTDEKGAFIGTFLQTGNASQPYAPGPDTALSLAGFSGWNGIVAGDFNRDGKPDIAICFSSISGANVPGTVKVFLGNGDGTFTEGAGSVALAVTAFEMITGDFNGDGKPDLAFSSGAVALGNGDGTFGPPIQFFPGNSNLFGIWLGAADFNHDGKLDLAFQVCQGCEIPAPLKIFLGNGDGTFRAGSSYTFDGLAAWAAIADVNQDGIPDIIDLNGVEGGRHSIAAVLLGNGDGTFKQPSFVEADWSIQPNQIIATDLNGDGKIDLAVTDWDQNSLYLFAGNGDGTFGPQVQVGGGAGAGWLFSENLQGQTTAGFPDLLTVDFEPNSFVPPQAGATAVSILYNLGAK